MKAILIVKKDTFDYIKCIVYLSDGVISWNPIKGEVKIIEGVS